MNDVRQYRFSKEMVQTKPGPGGKTLDYVDVRHIGEVLDGYDPDWSSRQTRLGKYGEQFVVTVALTFRGVTREDVGEGKTPFDAQNQAFRRAAAAHGLGAYMWTGDELAPVELIFASRDEAIQWGKDSGVFNGGDHAEHAYEFVKRIACHTTTGSQRAKAAAVFNAWKAEVEHRIIEANEKAAAKLDKSA